MRRISNRRIRARRRLEATRSLVQHPILTYAEDHFPAPCSSWPDLDWRPQVRPGTAPITAKEIATDGTGSSTSRASLHPMPFSRCLDFALRSDRMVGMACLVRRAFALSHCGVASLDFPTRHKCKMVQAFFESIGWAWLSRTRLHWKAKFVLTSMPQKSGPRRCRGFRSVCRMGRICHGAECGDRPPQSVPSFKNKLLDFSPPLFALPASLC